MKCKRAEMENINEDSFESCEQFGDWSACSSEHWDENQRDGTSFGDWTTFKDDFCEERDTANLLSQEGQTSIYAHKNIELPHSRFEKLEIPAAAHKQTKTDRIDEYCTVIHDCFHADEILRDTEMNILPLSQLLHSSSHTLPMPAILLRKGANFYHKLMCEPKSQSILGPKSNLYSHKQLIETLDLKQSITLHNTELEVPHLGSEKPVSSSPDIIQTKLTAPTHSQNSPGFFYQISHQWLSQYSLRFQSHQDKKDLF